jgi:hypothetical protein
MLIKVLKIQDLVKEVQSDAIRVKIQDQQVEV